MTMLTYWLIAINIAAFALFGLDKARAKRGAWRIPEKTLFLSAILGGGAGALAGMYAFRHKTKHKSFVFGIPLILAAELAAALYFGL